MIRCLFLIQSLGGGGAERVLLNLVNHMDKNLFDITVETMFFDGVHKNDLCKDVTYICKKAPYFKGVSKVLRYVPSKWLYKFFVGKRKYDVVIAYMHGLPTHVISGCKDANTKTITWLHNGDMETTTLFNSFPSYNCALKSLRRFDLIVPVANSIAEAFREKTGISDNVVVCYNINDFEKIKKLSQEEVFFQCEKPVLCSVGRFSNDKGFLRLIEISHKLHTEGVKHTLLLVGDGIELEKAKTRANELGEKVIFTGFDINPYKYIDFSDVFVCSSFFEGMCTASIEALFLGKPSISTRVSGAEELLGDKDEYGIVTEITDESLLLGIKKLLLDNDLRDYYAQIATESAKRFGVEETVKKVEGIIIDLVNGRNTSE